MRQAEPIVACIEAKLRAVNQTSDHASYPVFATCTHHSAAKPAWASRAHRRPAPILRRISRSEESLYGCSAARLEQSRRSAADECEPDGSVRRTVKRHKLQQIFEVAHVGLAALCMPLAVRRCAKPTRRRTGTNGTWSGGQHAHAARTWSGNNTVRLAAVADRWARLRRHQPAWQRETWAECVIAHIVCDWRVAPRPLRMACSSGSGSARRGCQRLERETYLPGLRSGASA